MKIWQSTSQSRRPNEWLSAKTITEIQVSGVLGEWKMGLNSRKQKQKRTGTNILQEQRNKLKVLTNSLWHIVLWDGPSLKQGTRRLTLWNVDLSWMDRVTN